MARRLRAPGHFFCARSDFDFDLPDELIAQEPPAERGGSRLMVVDPCERRRSRIAPSPTCRRCCVPGDLLVVNDTRVFPARLIGTRLPGGGAAECFLIRPAAEPDTWIALVHPGPAAARRIAHAFQGAQGARVHGCAGAVLHAEIIGRHFHGRRTVRLWTEDGSPVRDTIDAIGHVPLPPYIKRPDATSDRDRYQTVYARERGSIAAPTAGLHFTPAILDALAAKGIERVSITLHVGYGTFQPIRVERVEEHADGSRALRGDGGRRRRAVEGEAGESARDRRRHDDDAHARIAAAVARRRRSAPARVRPRCSSGRATSSESCPGLITNFHLPQSSLLMLVSALGGRERILAAYREAVQQRYRFYSYGDAMLIA